MTSHQARTRSGEPRSARTSRIGGWRAFLLVAASVGVMPSLPVVHAAMPATSEASSVAAPLASTGARRDDDAPIVTTQSGSIRGARTADVERFLGVPYARPPVGALRWRSPQAPIRWSGIRDAATFAPSCMQMWPAPNFGPYTSEFVDTPKPSEDCLYLNVWTPVKRAARLPLFVWIHGGGFLGGSGAVPIYDGTGLARRGVVVVTLNYRVGPFGFLAHPELTRESRGAGAGNYGLEDMIAALRWVKANAAAFGGDAARVTIAGQSAGAIAVNDLVVSPPARGLFVGAMAQSGSGMGINAIPLAEAEANGVAFATRLGAKTLAAMRALSAEQVQAGMPDFRESMKPGAAKPIQFRPVLDGVVLPVDAVDGAARPASNVPFVTGFNADEFLPFATVTIAEFERSVRARYGAHADRLLSLYPHATDAEADASARQLARDAYFSALTLWADARARSGARVYAYRFEHPLPVKSGASFGTFHTGEVPYVFGVLDRSFRPYTDADDAVAAQLQDYWLNFVRSGDPNGAGRDAWAPFAPGSTFLMGLGDGAGPVRPTSGVARFAAFADFVKAGGRLSIN